MPDLNSLPQKTYSLICMMQKNIFLSFDLWWEVRGHFRQPPRGQTNSKDFFCHIFKFFKQRENIYRDMSSKICEIHKIWSKMTSQRSLTGRNGGLRPPISKFQKFMGRLCIEDASYQFWSLYLDQGGRSSLFTPGWLLWPPPLSYKQNSRFSR